MSPIRLSHAAVRSYSGDFLIFMTTTESTRVMTHSAKYAATSNAVSFPPATNVHTKPIKASKNKNQAAIVAKT
jgi:hypothetical protein